jgi:uncharacterized protein (UPF0548 family)
MFLLRRPTEDEIRRFIDSQRDAPFSYPAVGASRLKAPARYITDHNRIRLGSGEDVFNRAARALRQWKMFDTGFTQLCWTDTPIEAGRVVAVLARHLGVWSLNACRVVYVLDEDGPVRRLGFAYGTLMEHAESGEERFSIEWSRDEDTVVYDLLAFSRPNHPLAKIGFPVARMLQKRFADCSKQAMLRAVNDLTG